MRLMKSGVDAYAIANGCVAEDGWLQSATVQQVRVPRVLIDARARVRD